MKFLDYLDYQILGALFGAMGVALAAPLLAVGRIAVLRFYVQDWLKDQPGVAPLKK